jgi:hypothetical protein
VLRRFFDLDAVQNIWQSHVRIAEDDQLGAAVFAVFRNQTACFFYEGVSFSALRKPVSPEYRIPPDRTRLPPFHQCVQDGDQHQ